MMTQLADVVQTKEASDPWHPQRVVVPAIQVLQGLDGLEALANAWDGLVARAGGPMQYAAWAQTCAAVLSTPERSLQVIVVGTPQPRAIAPLVRRQGRLPRLELLGVGELHEPMDFLYAAPAALAPLAQALVQLGIPLFLQRIPADSPVVDTLRSAYRGRGIFLCRPMLGSPWISLDAGWIQPEQQLNAGRRSDLRRARRIAESMGPVSCEVLSPTPAELPALLAEAFRVEAAGWKGWAGSALTNDAVRRPFYQLYAAAACQQGILRLCFLRIGGRAVAMQLAVECGNRFWLLKIGYDEAFARCSPGTLLLLETVRYAAARGLCSYEFLGIVEPWTQMWTQHVRPCVSLWAYPATRQGALALAADVAKSTWRRCSQAVQGRR